MRKLVVILTLLWPLTVNAVPVHAAPLEGAPKHIATVTDIVDGDTLIIDPPFEDGNEIRLVGLQAPKLPLGRKGFEAWPLSTESKQALSDITLGKKLGLSFGGVRRDRYGRWLAHLHVIEGGAPGLWVQGEMLRLGMARVYSFPDNRALVAEMLALEREARAAERGIWALPYYAVRGTDPGLLAPYRGTFQVIEGRVADAADVKGTVYLNFGADWKTDFTVAIDRRNRDTFDGAFDPTGLSGAAVRVRGWLKSRNGPMIEATHPEQIEILGR